MEIDWFKKKIMIIFNNKPLDIEIGMDTVMEYLNLLFVDHIKHHRSLYFHH